MPETNQTLCRLLAGTLHPQDLSPAELTEVWRRAEATGGVELLAATLTSSENPVTSVARERALACLRAAAVTEMLRRRLLCRLVDAFQAAGAPMLLMKGAALAYTIYPQPHLRPALDIDVFIARENLDASEAALTSIGFTRELEPDVESASMQRHYTCHDRHGAEHFVDLHWRITNRHLFASALIFEDAWKASQPVSQLHPSARTLGTVDALLLACIHRVAHHADDPDVIWLWDIHLLAGAMTRAEVKALAARAVSTEINGVTTRGLELSRAMFGTAVDPWLMRELQQSPHHEATAERIGRRTRHVEIVLSDLAALPTSGDRIRLLREHLFPGLAYMRAKYPGWPRLLLPLVYVYRIARGAPKWLQRSRS